MEADVERTMRKMLWAASGDGFAAETDPPTPRRSRAPASST